MVSDTATRELTMKGDSVPDLSCLASYPTSVSPYICERELRNRWIHVTHRKSTHRSATQSKRCVILAFSQAYVRTGSSLYLMARSGLYVSYVLVALYSWCPPE